MIAIVMANIWLGAQSLADVARAQRRTTHLTTHVYTNEDFGATGAPHASSDAATNPVAASDTPAKKSDSVQANALLNDIRASSEKVKALEAHIKELQNKLDERDSPSKVGTVAASKLEVSQRVVVQGPYGLAGGPSPGVCGVAAAAAYSPYKDWCDEPDKWRAEMAKTQAELDAERAKLEALQESARKMGIGSKMYDPE